MRHRLILLCALMLFVPEAPSALARSGRRIPYPTAKAQALHLLQIGVRLLNDGYYVGALAKFRQAYKVFPSPKIFFNIGQTLKELGRYPAAIKSYNRFLKEAPKTTQARLFELARKAVAGLMKQVVVLRVVMDRPGARVSINGTPQGLSPNIRPVILMPGRASIVAKKAGFVTAVVEVRLKPGARVTRRLVLKQLPSKVIKVVYKTVRKPRKGLPLLWTGIAVTAAASIVAAVLGGLALQKQAIVDDDEQSLSARQEAADQGRTFQRTTDGMLISAGVLAAGTLIWGLVVVLRSGGTRRIRIKQTERPLSIIPVVGSGTTGASLGVRF